MTKETNLLFILSDQHSGKVLGCSGHPMVQTPNLDRLAARGTRFTQAYCNSPICVPSRASLATGQYVHKIRFWDNAHPYDGSVPSWGHRLMGQGHRVTSVGKLHYRKFGDPNGFHEEINPMHVVDGVGDLLGLIRDELPPRKRNRLDVLQAGGGESTYTRYDHEITAASLRWLKEEAPKYSDKPWVLFVSLVCPHPPMIAPERFFRLYPQDKVPWPNHYWTENPPLHPAMAEFRQSVYPEPMEEAIVRKAIAAYFGMCSYLDHNVGQLLDGLDTLGLSDHTRVIYTSDHGENLGNRGLWGKSVMYEDAAAVPLIIAGADIPQGHSVAAPVSLVDVLPTVVECVGARAAEADEELPGYSLLGMANGENPERTVFSEYHAANSTTATYLVRRGEFKYVHYVKYRPQLFNLENDPEETEDLAERK